MTINCTAIYERGILRPLTPPALREGEQVEVIILAREPEVAREFPAEMLAEIAALPAETPLADVLSAIAALPSEPSAQVFSGQDHDNILYGEKGAR